jgi:hypothetical protein
MDFWREFFCFEGRGNLINLGWNSSLNLAKLEAPKFHLNTADSGQKIHPKIPQTTPKKIHQKY